MATKIKNKKMLLFMAEKDLYRVTYTGKEIREKAPTGQSARVVGWDDLSLLDVKPAFDQIRVGFVEFRKKVPLSSSLFGSVFVDNYAVKSNYDKYVWVYHFEDYKKWADGLEETDEIDFLVYQSQCFGSVSLEGTNTEEEVKTSCGTEKYAKEDTSWTISITGYYERFDSFDFKTSLTALMLSSKFDMTLERKNELKDLQKSERKSFKFMLLFMSGEGSGFEGWALFDGSLNTVSLGANTDSVYQQYTANISNESPPWLALRDFSFLDLAEGLAPRAGQPAPLKGK